MLQIEKEIDYLNQMLLKMGYIVEDNINQAYAFYKSKKTCTINDDVVNQHERLIESICLDILIKERPYASDLRRVSGILKLVADLERIGDHAVDIVEFAEKLSHIEGNYDFSCESIFDKAIWMVKSSILSFVRSDRALAESVIVADEEVDKMYDEKIKELVDRFGKSLDGQFAIYTTLVVKYLERIADHAVNIAEWVIYIINGYHKDKQIF